jgi:hypothetical protein
MVSAIGIEHWKQNYIWFIEQMKKYNLLSQHQDNTPMLLEVRNDDWTPKAIQEYL